MPEKYLAKERKHKGRKTVKPTSSIHEQDGYRSLDEDNCDIIAKEEARKNDPRVFRANFEDKVESKILSC